MKLELDEILLEAAKQNDIDSIRLILKPFYEELLNLYENDLLATSEDYSSGSDTYGYENLDSIKSTLCYIYGKWNAAFRVRWLIELINPEYKLWDGTLH